jgi:hypothetical protein
MNYYHTLQFLRQKSPKGELIYVIVVSIFTSKEKKTTNEKKEKNSMKRSSILSC